MNWSLCLVVRIFKCLMVLRKMLTQILLWLSQIRTLCHHLQFLMLLHLRLVLLPHNNPCLLLSFYLHHNFLSHSSSPNHNSFNLSNKILIEAEGEEVLDFRGIPVVFAERQITLHNTAIVKGKLLPMITHFHQILLGSLSFPQILLGRHSFLSHSGMALLLTP